MSTKRKGLCLALGAYLMWALLSLFWKQLDSVPAYDVFAYRISWTFVTMLLYLYLTGQRRKMYKEISHLIKDKKSFSRMLFASVFIALNWLVYIYAVTNGQATEASLGYYVTPLISVVLSVYFLKERLASGDKLAILSAGIGVLLLVILTGRLPLVTLLLAFSFGIYGLLKKQVQLSSDVAMLFEAGLILPFALAYLLLGSSMSWWDFGSKEQILLALSGIITAIPLLLFAEAVKRAPLNQVGFIQYLNPTIQFFIAIFIFDEGVTSGELVGFAFIWLAIIIFIGSQFIPSRKETI